MGQGTMFCKFAHADEELDEGKVIVAEKEWRLPNLAGPNVY